MHTLAGDGQSHGETSESETWSEDDVTRKPVACKTATGKPHACGKSDCQGSPKAERTELVTQSTRVSSHSSSHGSSLLDRREDPRTRPLTTQWIFWTCIWLFWCIFLNTTLRAAVHLGQDHWHYVKNHLWNSVGQLFNETGKLISEQKEVTGVSTFDFQDATWMSTSLLCEKACRITNAKVYVFSDSVLCVGKMWQQRKKPIARMRAKIRTIVRRPEIIQTVFWCGFEACRARTILFKLLIQKGQQMQHLCRECTMPRNEKGTRVRGWILKNMRIGPVLNIKVCYHDDRCSTEVQIPSLCQDRAVSRVRIVSGVDKYVTESMLTTKEVDMASGKPIAKARTRQKPTVTLTSVSIPVPERKWIDIETQRSHDHECYDVSKGITRLLRHGQSVPRGSDGAIHYSDIIDECRKKKFDDASQWLLEDWISTLAKGRGAKKRFQHCGNPNSSCTFEQFKDIQETMLLILHCKTMYCYRKDLPSTSTTSETRMNWIP